MKRVRDNVGNKQMIYSGLGGRYRLAFRVLTITLGVFILVNSLIPAQPSLSVNNMDKVLHILAYLALGLATFPAFPRMQPIVTWLGLCGFGAGIEILQGVMQTGRSTDVLDGVANASGALLALLAWAGFSLLVRVFTQIGD